MTVRRDYLEGSMEREMADRRKKKGIRESIPELLFEFFAHVSVGVAGSWLKGVILRE